MSDIELNTLEGYFCPNLQSCLIYLTDSRIRASINDSLDQFRFVSTYSDTCFSSSPFFYLLIVRTRIATYRDNKIKSVTNPLIIVVFFPE